MEALVLVDIQNDFLPGGALAVPEGDQIVQIANALQQAFPLVVATQDWHPANHLSFAVNHPGKRIYEQVALEGLPQTLWPVHCVQQTRGAELCAALDRRRIERCFYKGTDARIDSYSALYDNGHRKSTGLGEWLKARGVSEIFLCGLATDYCVKHTALDAVRVGFKVVVVEDACRGVNLAPEDVRNAISDMRKAGVSLVLSADLLMNRRSPRP
jgi:nicotinamidase/pyrazinamidase